jgi:hypothetical protein
MHQVLSGYVERKEMPGLVALVSRHDDVHVETLGTLAFGDPAPMQRDTIFRIASITKPVTAVAAMILVEECRLRLDESVEPWLPELANRRVLKSISSQLDDTVPSSTSGRWCTERWNRQLPETRPLARGYVLSASAGAGRANGHSRTRAARIRNTAAPAARLSRP